jgi:hypothetical protein
MARLQNIAEGTGYHDLRLGIESVMVRIGLRMVLTSLIAVLLVSGAQLPEMRADTQGTFRGQVVAAPRGERSAGLLYLKGHDGNVRRVVVVRAAVVYDAAVPVGERKKSAKLALTPGAEVRVTALVDADSGEWTASRVEVIANHAADFEDDYDEDAGPPDEVTVPRNPVVDRRTI